MNRIGVIAFILMFAGSAIPSYGMDIKETAENVTLDNGRIALELGKGKTEIILKAAKPAGLKLTPIIISVRKTGSAEAVALKEVKASKSADAVSLTAVFGEEVGSIEIIVKDDYEYVGFKPRAGITLSIMQNASALIIPDRLSCEDFAIHAQGAPQKVYVPADNHLCLNLLEGEDALLACVWESPQAAICLRKENETFGVMEYADNGDGKALWLGLIAAKGAWHKVTQELGYIEPVKLAWVPPFQARWFVTLKKDKGYFPEEDGLFNTWVFVDKNPEKKPYIENGVGVINLETWKAWASGSSSFIYPFNFENSVSLINFPKITAFDSRNSYDPKFQPLVYPLELTHGNKWKSEEAALPFAAVEQLLGAETFSRLCAKDRSSGGSATCGATERIEKIFYREEEKEKKAEIKKDIDSTNKFVVTLRARIEEYRQWGRELDTLLLEKQKQTPACAELLENFRQDLSRLQWTYAERAERMKTPEYFKTLTEKLYQLVDSSEEDEKKEEDCKRLGREIRTIGGGQDGCLGMMRFTAKVLRRKATSLIALGADDKSLMLLLEIRAKTVEMLKEKTGMEGK